LNMYNYTLNIMTTTSTPSQNSMEKVP